MKTSRQSSKLLSLEALRGGAAIFVLLQTFLLGFLPQAAGILPFVDNSNSLMGSPLLVFINGMAAVMMFFVLSGFVLSLKGLQTNATNKLIDAGLKRWFRLAPIVLLSVLLSWLLFHLGFFHFQDAAKLSRSDWLNHFAYGELPQNYSPALTEALWQGAIGTFLFGEKSLNPNLWIMKWEFFGSYIALALAFLIGLKQRWIFWLALALTAALLFHFVPILVPFLIGMVGAVLGVQKWKMKTPATVGLLLAGLFLCGYWYPIKAYFWARYLPFNDEQRQVLILSLGAFALLVTFASQNFLSKKLNGKISLWLGLISFPLYLVHMLVVASFASWAFVLVGGGISGILVAAVVTLLVSAPLVWVFVLFDRWWASILSRWRFQK